MKHCTWRNVAALVFSAALLFTACKKGDTGPQGEDGPAGPAGSKGDKGDKGDTGTANVIYSAWLDVAFTPVKNTTTGDTTAWLATIAAPKLTNAILTSGAIKVYVNAGTAAQPVVFPLPVTDLFALTGLLNLNMYFTPAKIELYATDNGSTYTNTSGAKQWQYRYILVPGGVTARSAIDWNNYQQVKDYLKLQD
jgi:hypothetical protein